MLSIIFEHKTTGATIEVLAEGQLRTKGAVQVTNVQAIAPVAGQPKQRSYVATREAGVLRAAARRGWTRRAADEVLVFPTADWRRTSTRRWENHS